MEQQNTAMLPLLDVIKDGDFVVMSWTVELQSFVENRISLDIAVLQLSTVTTRTT